MAGETTLRRKLSDVELRDMLQSELNEILRKERSMTSVDEEYREMSKRLSQQKSLAKALTNNKTFLSLMKKYQGATPEEKKAIEIQAKAFVIVAGNLWLSLDEPLRKAVKAVTEKELEEYKILIIKDLLATYEAPTPKSAEREIPSISLSVPPVSEWKKERKENVPPKPKPEKEEEAPKITKVAKAEKKLPEEAADVVTAAFLSFIKPELRKEVSEPLSKAEEIKKEKKEAEAKLKEKEEEKEERLVAAEYLKKPQITEKVEVKEAGEAEITKAKKTKVVVLSTEKEDLKEDFIASVLASLPTLKQPHKPKPEEKEEIRVPPAPPVEKSEIERKKKEEKKEGKRETVGEAEKVSLERLKAEELEKESLKEPTIPLIGRKKKEKEDRDKGEE
jgi:hypothetical protein